jgi:hypothetical protein
VVADGLGRFDYGGVDPLVGVAFDVIYGEDDVGGVEGFAVVPGDPLPEVE